MHTAALASSVRPLPYESSAEVRHRGLHGTKVAIVDDQQTAHLLLREILYSVDAGISTLSFVTARDAMVWLEDNDCDLVITDFLMPEMDGIELTRAIRGNARLGHVPVIMITAAEERSVRLRALACGVLQFLRKPLDPIEVQTSVRNVLLLTSTYRDLKRYTQRIETQLQEALTSVHVLAPDSVAHFANDGEGGEVVTVSYEKLFALASCVAGVQELVTTAQERISDLEFTLSRPLRGRIS